MNNLLFIIETFEGVGLSKVLANQFLLSIGIISICLLLHFLEKKATQKHQQEL